MLVSCRTYFVQSGAKQADEYTAIVFLLWFIVSYNLGGGGGGALLMTGNLLYIRDWKKLITIWPS